MGRNERDKMTKEIQLNRGLVALVDDKNYEELNKYKWSAYFDSVTYYALRRVLESEGGKRKTIKMHHQILGTPPKGFVTHHGDGSGLNNQEDNIYFVTYRKHCSYRRLLNKTSQYTGVHWHKASQKWQARIRINRKRKHLGTFIDEKDAAYAYRKALFEVENPLTFSSVSELMAKVEELKKKRDRIQMRGIKL